MFVRLKPVAYKGTVHQYLQIVSNRRENGKVKQTVVASLGKLSDLKAAGDLDQIIQGLVKHSETLKVVDAHQKGSAQILADRAWGPALVFEHLWKALADKVERQDLPREAFPV